VLARPGLPNEDSDGKLYQPNRHTTDPFSTAQSKKKKKKKRKKRKNYQLNVRNRADRMRRVHRPEQKETDFEQNS
jgi:delta-aminolevulinic acid dehydratase/porphobilinogen synthase